MNFFIDVSPVLIDGFRKEWDDLASHDSSLQHLALAASRHHHEKITFLSRTGPETFDGEDDGRLFHVDLTDVAEKNPGGNRQLQLEARQRPLPTQDALPRRYHACRLRALGLHRPAGRPGAQAKSQPDTLPRRVCPEQ